MKTKIMNFNNNFTSWGGGVIYEQKKIHDRQKEEYRFK